MSMKRRGLWAAAAFFLGGPLAADPMTDAAAALCDKVKACSMAQVAEADMTDEMRQMMEPMLEGMCASMRSSVEEVASGHPLYRPGIDCMNSMAALSCDQIQESGEATPACLEYETLARELYGE